MMTPPDQPHTAFVAWWQQHCKGDEKGEAQIFIDRLLQSFGHRGALEAGGIFENRVRRKREGRESVSFADFVLPGIVVIEMKKRGENLARHYDQLEEYWKRLETRPRYAVLCNFDELWIYDFPTQFYDPVDRVPLVDLPRRAAALEFLVPDSTRTPVFQNNLVDVTRDAAHSLSLVFKSLVKREIDRPVAQRFILQCLVALFAEDIQLLPGELFTRAIDLCLETDASTADELFMLFTLMNTPGRSVGRKYQGVDYFNGGLFSQIDQVHLTRKELEDLRHCAGFTWSRVRPAIFGVIFEDSLEKQERHQIGAHFTSEQDIKRIVDPVIVQPWDARIDAAQTAAELRQLHVELCQYQVLDPACGSGNFLYIAYREMKKLERRLLDKLALLPADPEPAAQYLFVADPTSPPRALAPDGIPYVSARQFHGFDVNPFAVDLAKVTLMLAKKLAIDEFHFAEQPLPLDNLDANIRCEDALFADWGDFDACIGNPPYLGAKILKREYGVAYVNRVRDAFPEVPGNADYCVYWFRKAHTLLKPGARAGLVGTNTIRQNYSRIGGLDYLVAHGGVIYDAVSSMPWSGDAAVHVSIVNWSKGNPPQSTRNLHLFLGDDKRELSNAEHWQVLNLPQISSALSEEVDVNGAKVLACNTDPKRVFQGQIPGHDGFILLPSQAHSMAVRDPMNKQVLFPYLIGRDLLSKSNSQPTRYVIDLNRFDLIEAQQFQAAFRHIEEKVLPYRLEQADTPSSDDDTDESERHLSQWWKHTRGRLEVINKLKEERRYIVCSRVTKRPIFDFVSNRIHPDTALMVFAFNDDYTFAILQSNVHWQWFIRKASTLKSDYRYTPHSVFDTFPFPQQPTPAQVKAVAAAGRALHEYRREAMRKSDRLTLRTMYRSLEQPGKNPLKDLHAHLDAAVLVAYGFDPSGDVLAQLLALNLAVAGKIERGEPVTAPGIPAGYPTPDELVSPGCIEPPELV